VLRALMLGEKQQGELKLNPVQHWWRTPAALSGELQRKTPFRFDPNGRARFVLLPDEDGKIEFRRYEKDGGLSLVDQLKHDIHLTPGPRISFWGEPDYASALETLADSLGQDIPDCARRFGVIDLPEKREQNGWNYHPALGFSRFS
jgi:CRISPR-associated endonuclease/helicase Cas3